MSTVSRLQTHFDLSRDPDSILQHNTSAPSKAPIPNAFISSMQPSRNTRSTTAIGLDPVPDNPYGTTCILLFHGVPLALTRAERPGLAIRPSNPCHPHSFTRLQDTAFKEEPCPELSGVKGNKHEIKHTRLTDQVRARNVTWRGPFIHWLVLGRRPVSFGSEARLPRVTFHPNSIPWSVAIGLHKKKESGILAICALRGHLPASGTRRLVAVCSSS